MVGLRSKNVFNISFNVALLLNAFIEPIQVESNEYNDDKPVLNKALRLPKTVVPQSYDIKIISFLERNNFTFKGEVSIWVYAKEETSNITLHVNNLKIDSTSVEHLQENNNTRNLEITSFQINSFKEFLIINLKESLKQNQNYTIRIAYEGILNEDLRGFYKIEYTENNQTTWAAATHFQPTDARMAFPCFDEPEFKATFKINLARPKNKTSLSNMPKKGPSEPVEGLPNYEWDHYDESPRMSTYLVCFVISDFENRTSDNFSVWARREMISQVEYGLNIGPRILHFYENYLQTNYSLPKMDMIALPNLLPIGMENWGLITYRENALLYKDGVTTLANQMVTTITVAHELAHQFFGNLVTLKWWSETWLNEGFAQYFSYLGVNEVQPEWNILDRFISLDVNFALNEGAKNITHSLVFNVEDRNEIFSIFDYLTYVKGASIVYMMEHFLTQPVFRKGLMSYINTKKYGNAEGDDLFVPLTTIAHEDQTLQENITVKDIMNSWLSNKGYPIVNVTRNYIANTVTFTQNRFYSEHIPNESQSLWWIPISYTTKNIHNFNNTAPKLWLEEIRTKTVNLTARRNEWLIVNLKQSGFYVVNYDLENWMMIIGQLQNAGGYNQIHVINRMQILHDLFAFAKVGISNYALALEASKYLIHEHSELPWSVALEDLLSVSKLLTNTEHYHKFRQYLKRLIGPIYSRIGFDLNNQEYLTGYKVRHAACSLGLQDCVQNSYNKFLIWKNVSDPDQNIPINPKLRKMIYCVVGTYGGEDDWEFLWQRFVNLKLSFSEIYSIIEGMSCSQNHQILTTYLNRTLTRKSGLSVGKILAVFVTLGKNIAAQDLTFKHFKDNWNKIVRKVGKEVSSGILSDVVENMYTVSQLNEVKEFCAQVDIGEEFRAEFYEKIQENIDFANKHYNNVAQWMSQLDFRHL